MHAWGNLFDIFGNLGSRKYGSANRSRQCKDAVFFRQLLTISAAAAITENRSQDSIDDDSAGLAQEQHKERLFVKSGGVRNIRLMARSAIHNPGRQGIALFHLLDFISSAAIPSAAWHKVQQSQSYRTCRMCGTPTVTNWTEWRIESGRTSTPA